MLTFDPEKDYIFHLISENTIHHQMPVLAPNAYHFDLILCFTGRPSENESTSDSD